MTEEESPLDLQSNWSAALTKSWKIPLPPISPTQQQHSEILQANTRTPLLRLGSQNQIAARPIREENFELMTIERDQLTPNNIRRKPNISLPNLGANDADDADTEDHLDRKPEQRHGR